MKFLRFGTFMKLSPRRRQRFVTLGFNCRTLDYCIVQWEFEVYRTVNNVIILTRETLQLTHITPVFFFFCNFIQYHTVVSYWKMGEVYIQTESLYKVADRETVPRAKSNGKVYTKDTRLHGEPTRSRNGSVIFQINVTYYMLRSMIILKNCHKTK